MKRLLLILSLCLVPAARAQDSLPPIRFVVLDDYIRDRLSKDWDAHAADWPMLERGYCLGWQLDFFAQEFAYRVTQIESPDSVRAGHSGINFSCAGKFPGHLAQLHVHPATSCLHSLGPCFRGGAYAWQCEPSDRDRYHLLRLGQPFAVIQCSREATVAFFPDSTAPYAIRAPMMLPFHKEKQWQQPE